MWYIAFIRFIRRRIILGLILTLSLCYCIFSYVEKSEFLDNDEIVPVKRTQPFIWRTLQQHNTSSEADINCRNSVQGKVLIVDDRETTPLYYGLDEHYCSSGISFHLYTVWNRKTLGHVGYVCPRHEILGNGCCNNDVSNVFQYSCETCKPNNCCAIYEYCISCCLHPDKKDVLESVLGKATEENSVLFASVTDHFELCLAKCRTNSQSVQHENSYRDPRAKHCYGELAPGTNTVETEV